jgi:serine/threonine protein kinase
MPVAIKMLRHDMAMEPDFIETFREEAKTIARFGHENIVKIYDIEERYRTVFIIMEYLEGRTLQQILDATPRLPPVQALKYLLQICTGLHYAHQQDIVHQDIKPANIFILPDDTLKIVDFGLACTCGTETMMTGTPFYMSPEQVECLPVDTRTDIYALGIMTYEMVTGQRPYPEADAWAVMDLHVTQDIPDPLETAADIPDPLRKMILKACARDPAQRYANVSQIIDDLRTLVEVFDITVFPQPPDKEKMTTLYIRHMDDQREDLNRLLEDFKKDLAAAGMTLKTSDS